LGFAIQRTPGFQNNITGSFADKSWLPNRLGFNGPPPEGQPDPSSNKAPIQKFLWWDARLDGLKPQSKLTYQISPVCGTVQDFTLIQNDSIDVEVAIPSHIEFGIGTWFNRAVMSSQAFSRILKALKINNNEKPSQENSLKLRKWLANGMELPLADFILSSSSLIGAIYHLTDNLWVIPAFKTKMMTTQNMMIGLVYDAKIKRDPKTDKPLPNPNNAAIETLQNVQFFPRDKTSIMHNKFLVAGEDLLSENDAKSKLLTCGSSNYTTDGLTSQANLIHTFNSSELAELYWERFQFLKENPKKSSTAKDAKWSRTITVGDAGIRVFFSPEPRITGETFGISIDTIVKEIHSAKSSVIFCLFTPTDERLRQACFSAGDAGKMMFGLVNRINKTEPELNPSSSGHIPADQLAALEIYHRSKDKKDVIGSEFFNASAVPSGFQPEINIFPGTKPPPYPPVIIHHKFIVIDAETESPLIYTGSANMSGNSVFNNDENLLEIRGSPRLAHIYLSEFLRLYEHYRARARFIAFRRNRTRATAAEFGLALRKDSSWAKKHYTPGTPEYKSRIRMIAI
jgi:hypothetical protein